jgi:GxxExxY protein
MTGEYRSDEGYRGSGGGGYGERRDDRRDDRGRGGYRGDRRGGGGERRGIPLSALDPTTTEASRKLIGAAIEVHKNLGPGYSQAAYCNALKMELEALSVRVKHGHTFPVNYHDKKIGECSTDLFIEERFFVDVLTRSGPVTTYERLALRAKLKAADLELGLIINFAERRLKDGLVRVVNIDKIQKEKGLSFDDEGDGHEGGDFDDRG